MKYILSILLVLSIKSFGQIKQTIVFGDTTFVIDSKILSDTIYRNGRKTIYLFNDCLIYKYLSFDERTEIGTIYAIPINKINKIFSKEDCYGNIYKYLITHPNKPDTTKGLQLLL